jgi:hypothetical protein
MASSRSIEGEHQECLEGDCSNRTYGMMRWRSFKVWRCDDVRDSLKDQPIADAWGARVRVVCNAGAAEASVRARAGTSGTTKSKAVRPGRASGRK